MSHFTSVALSFPYAPPRNQWRPQDVRWIALMGGSSRHISTFQPIFRTSSRSDNGIFLIQHQGALERMSPAFGAISVKMAG
jgi:hypothetical protein